MKWNISKLFIFVVGIGWSSGCTVINDVNTDQQTNPEWLRSLVNEKQVYAEMFSYDHLMGNKPPPESKISLNGVEFDKLRTPLSSLNDWSEPQATSQDTQPLTPTKATKPPQKSNLAQEQTKDPVNVTINNSITNDRSTPTKRQFTVATKTLSRIERLYNKSAGLSAGKQVAQFGYDILQSSAEVKNSPKTIDQQVDVLSTLDQSKQTGQSKPEQNIPDITSGGLGPVDPEYVVGPGDEVKIRCSGGVEINGTFPVNRDGSIFIPRIGSINVASYKARQLRTTIDSVISKQFQNYHIDVSLGQLHTIRIMISGFLHDPGMKTIQSNSTLLDALSAAGGPTKDGTLRNFVLRRKGVPDQSFDLYSLLMGSGRGGDTTIISGDQISVGKIGKTVAVLTPERSAIYELKGPETLKNLIDKVGGISSFTSYKTVMIERTIANKTRAVEYIDYTHSGSYYLNDGDVVEFRPVDNTVDNTVAITGPVSRPGVYPFKQGMKVSDLLSFSEGFLINASLERAVLLRRLGDLDSFDQMLGDKKGRIKEQVIWVDLASIFSGKSKSDIQLNRLDRLKILPQSEVYTAPKVTILGAVKKPGRYKRSSGLNLADLLMLAGGPTNDAFSGEGTIVRRRYAKDARHFDIKVIPFSLAKVLDGGLEAGIQLQNYDQVVIRKVQTLQVGVNVKGHVQFPGYYILPERAKISDMLAAAGGLLTGADLGAAFFARERVKNMQRQRLENLMVRMQETFERGKAEVTRDGEVAESVAGQMNQQGLRKMSQNMQSIQPTGRVIVDLTQEDFLESDENLALENGDTLFIPRKMNTIAVMGRVRSPNVFIWKQGMTIADYIQRTGGYEEDAEQSDVYVIRANGEVRSASQTMMGRLFSSYELRFGDTVLVPASGPERSARRVFDDYIKSMRGVAALGISGATMDKILKSPDENTSVGSDVGVSTEDQYRTKEDISYDELLNP